MVPLTRKKKPKKPMPPLGGKKPKKPKKKDKQQKSAGTGPSYIGGTINTITCTLTFSVDATAVSIKVGTLESTVDEVQVFWNATQIYSTYAWDDPVLQAIPYACPPGAATLLIKLIYPGATVAYRKPNIYPTASAALTVTLPKV